MSRTFTRLVFCRTAAQLCNAALRFMLLLYLLRQTGSAALYGSVSAAVMIPMLLGLLLGGVLADRFRKQYLMAAFDGISALCLFFAATMMNRLSVTPFVLFTLSVLYAAEGLQQPTAQSCLPLLCGNVLTQGNAILQLASTLSEVLGTWLGSLLLEPLGLHWLLILCAGLLALVAAGESFLRIPHQPTSQRTVHAETHSDFRVLFRQSQSLLQLASVLALLNLAVVPAFTVGVPILIVQHLSLSDQALAFAQSAMSVGSLLGSVIAGIASKHLQLKQGSIILWFLTAVCSLLGLSVLPGIPVGASYAFVTFLSLCMMAAAALFQILLNAALLANIPAEQAGRTMSFVTALACLTQPAGQFLFGLAYDRAAAQPCIIPLLAAGISLFINIAATQIFRQFSSFTKS